MSYGGCGHGSAGQEHCQCGRGDYCSGCYGSCYDCFLDRRAEHVICILCGQRWHSPGFDTCFECRDRADRDEAARHLRLEILARDGFRCRYCGAAEGDLQPDPRLARPRCLPGCPVEHNHRWPCRDGCSRRHRHLKPGDDRACLPGCCQPHSHLARDDDGIRPARLTVDHILPCARGGTADPWNLQALCGVCNVAKGPDWWAGSPHHQARRVVMAAYLTYLRRFLASGQEAALEAEAAADALTVEAAVALNVADYRQRVGAASRSRDPGKADSRAVGSHLAARLPP